MEGGRFPRATAFISNENGAEASSMKLQARLDAAAIARASRLYKTARAAGSDVARARYLSAHVAAADATDASALSAAIAARQAASDARRAAILAQRKSRAAEGYHSMLASLSASSASSGSSLRSDAAQGTSSCGGRFRTAYPHTLQGSLSQPPVHPSELIGDRERQRGSSGGSSDGEAVSAPSGGGGGTGASATLQSRRSNASTLTGPGTVRSFGGTAPMQAAPPRLPVWSRPRELERPHPGSRVVSGGGGWALDYGHLASPLPDVPSPQAAAAGVAGADAKGRGALLPLSEGDEEVGEEGSSRSREGTLDDNATGTAAATLDEEGQWAAKDGLYADEGDGDGGDAVSAYQSRRRQPVSVRFDDELDHDAAVEDGVGSSRPSMPAVGSWDTEDAEEGGEEGGEEGSTSNTHHTGQGEEVVNSTGSGHEEDEDVDLDAPVHQAMPSDRGRRSGTFFPLSLTAPSSHTQGRNTEGESATHEPDAEMGVTTLGDTYTWATGFQARLSSGVARGVSQGVGGEDEEEEGVRGRLRGRGYAEAISGPADSDGPSDSERESERGLGTRARGGRLPLVGRGVVGKGCITASPVLLLAGVPPPHSLWCMDGMDGTDGFSLDGRATAPAGSDVRCGARPTPPSPPRSILPRLMSKTHAPPGTGQGQGSPPDFLRKGTGVTGTYHAGLTQDHTPPAPMPALVHVHVHAPIRSQTAVQERATSARAQDAQRESKRVLAAHRRRMEGIAARLDTVSDLKVAEARRRSSIEGRIERAAAHDAHVDSVRSMVRAARRLQRWARSMRMRALGRRAVRAVSPGPCATPLPMPMLAARRVMPSPVRTGVGTGEGATGWGGQRPSRHSRDTRETSLTAQLRASLSVMAGLDTHAGARRACVALRALLEGEPALDDGKTLAAAMEEAGVEGEGTVRGSKPYTRFEAVAIAIQQRGNVAAGQMLAGQLLKAYAALDDAGLATPLGTPERKDSNPALRPALARSARTLLAALPIAYFPEDILSPGGMQDDGAMVVDALSYGVAGNASGDERPVLVRGGRPAQSLHAQRCSAVVVQARVLLGHLHALCALIGGEGGKRGVERRVAGLLQEEDARFGLSPSDWPDLGLDASPYVTPELRSSLSQRAAQGGLDVDRAARLVHTTLACCTVWARYMDAFMVWKGGDGQRAAQSLARPFRALLLRRGSLAAEASTSIGSGDAGLEQLREGVESQLQSLHAQVTSLLGREGASTWVKDQVSSLNAEAQRESMRRQQQGQGQGQGVEERVVGPGVSVSPSPTRPVIGPVSSGRAPGQGSGFSPGFLLGALDGGGRGRPPRSPALGPQGAPPLVPIASPLTPPPLATAARSPGLGPTSPLPSPSPHVPPTAGVAPQAALFRSVMRNEGIAHELMLDPAFRLPDMPMPDGLEWEEDGVGGEPVREKEEEGAPPAGMVRGPSPTVESDLADLSRRVSSGMAGISARTSPGLHSIQSGLMHISAAGLGLLASSAENSGMGASQGGSTMPALDLDTPARPASEQQNEPPPAPSPQRAARLRLRHKGQLRIPTGPHADPAVLRTSAAFWEAALAAALHASPPAPGPTGTVQGHPAVDMVCAGLESVRESLVSLAPHRADFAADVSAHIDIEAFRSQLNGRAFSQADWVGLLRYIGALISSLEAPARGEDTRRWLSGAVSFVKRIAARLAEEKAKAGRAKGARGVRALSVGDTGVAVPVTQGTDGEEPILSDDLLILLPRVLAWAHWKASEVRLDTSNAHLSMLGPYLAGGRGAEYERAKFEDAVARGETRTDGVKAWLRATLDAGGREAASQVHAQGSAGGVGASPRAAAVGTLARAALRADYRIARLCLLRDGLLSLLSCPHALSMVSTVAARSPGGVAMLPDPSAPTPATAPSTESRPAQAQAVAPPGGVTASPGSSTALPPGLLAVPFPETFAMDAVRLTSMQNVLQKAALLSALTALVQQLVSALPAQPAGYTPPPPCYAPLHVPRTATARPAAGSGERGIVTLHANGPTVGNGGGAGGDEQGADSTDPALGMHGLQACLCAWLADERLRLPELTASLEYGVDSLARACGKMPLLPPEDGASAGINRGGSTTGGVDASISTLRSTLVSAVRAVVSSSHPLLAVYARRGLEAIRRLVTRELQDTMPVTGETTSAAAFPAWGRYLDEHGTPLPPLLQSALPPVSRLQEEVRATVTALARLIRHNQTVFEAHYRGMLAEM